MSDAEGSGKRLVIEFVLPPDAPTSGAEVAIADLGIDITGFTIASGDGDVTHTSVVESRHGPLVMLHGSAVDVAAVGSDPRVVGVWLDESPAPSEASEGSAADGEASHLQPEWSDPDTEGPERYIM